MKIYVCSSYGGLEENYDKAKKYAKYVLSKGHIPILSHTMLHGVLDDKYPPHREKGLEVGKLLMTLCDEIWVFGAEVTPGMAGEIMEAARLQIPVKEIKKLPTELTLADEVSVCLKEYDKHFTGLINTRVAYDIKECIDKGVSSELIIECMKKAARKSAAWNYAYGILKNCIAKGIFTAEEFLRENKKPQNNYMSTYDISELEKLINRP